MKSSQEEIIPIIGTAMGGGFYAGRIRVDDQVFALIVAPKAEGDFKSIWSASDEMVPDAKSYNDGAANTASMINACSELGLTVAGLHIGGHNDWYIPSQDELEVIYRNLKPTTEKNTLWGRSGINVSAPIQTYPYLADAPAQTLAEAFQAGGAEAFEENWYWTSTQHAGISGYAWVQYFNYGSQFNGIKSSSGRARAVRRLPI